MSSSAWFLRRHPAPARAGSRPQISSFQPAGRATWLTLAALCLGGCPSSDEPAADSGSAGSASTQQAGTSASSGSGAAADGGKGGSTAAAGSGTAAGSGGGEKKPATGLHGAFTLSLVTSREATAESPATDPRTSFLGLVNDGEKPSPTAWLEEQSASGCKLYTPVVSPLCDPACGSSAVCVADDKCEPYPKSQAVGTIRLTGVGDTPVELSPVGSSNNYQPKAGSMLPYPPCAENDELSLTVEGGAYSGFELKTKCIAPLEFQGPIKLLKATPLKLSWGVPSFPMLARMQVRLNISHHGGSRGEIRCDVDDNGMLELPATMVDRLLELGVAGFPTIILTRVSTGAAVGGEPENVEFIVQQYVERGVEIDGLVSCNDSKQCPSGQSCQSDLTCK